MQQQDIQIVYLKLITNSLIKITEGARERNNSLNERPPKTLDYSLLTNFVSLDMVVSIF